MGGNFGGDIPPKISPKIEIFPPQTENLGGGQTIWRGHKCVGGKTAFGRGSVPPKLGGKQKFFEKYELSPPKLGGTRFLQIFGSPQILRNPEKWGGHENRLGGTKKFGGEIEEVVSPPIGGEKNNYGQKWNLVEPPCYRVESPC